MVNLVLSPQKQGIYPARALPECWWCKAVQRSLLRTCLSHPTVIPFQSRKVKLKMLRVKAQLLAQNGGRYDKKYEEKREERGLSPGREL